VRPRCPPSAAVAISACGRGSAARTAPTSQAASAQETSAVSANVSPTSLRGDAYTPISANAQAASGTSGARVRAAPTST
jgi:hypothetical protein